MLILFLSLFVAPLVVGLLTETYAYWLRKRNK